MSIQILQYEFLGPIPLDEWGPPMEKTAYLIMSRDKDRFSVIYAGDCEKTDNKAFFVKHQLFQCWVEKSGSAKSLHLAILPAADSDSRKNILGRIINSYRPPCNPADAKPGPDYAVRKKDSGLEPKTFSCPCCGAQMKSEKILEKSTLFRCTGCGMSDTQLNS